jgi:hypothetical protein
MVGLDWRATGAREGETVASYGVGEPVEGKKLPEKMGWGWRGLIRLGETLITTATGAYARSNEESKLAAGLSVAQSIGGFAGGFFDGEIRRASDVARGAGNAQCGGILAARQERVQAEEVARREAEAAERERLRLEAEAEAQKAAKAEAEEVNERFANMDLDADEVEAEEQTVEVKRAS